MLKGNSEETEATQAQPVPVPDQSQAGGGLLGGILGGLGGLLGGAAAGNASAAPSAPGSLGGGLGGLLDQLKQAGLGEKVDSRVGQGTNHSIEPGQLGDAIGQKTLSEIAQHAGIDQQELLDQLSRFCGIGGQADNERTSARRKLAFQAATGTLTEFAS